MPPEPTRALVAVAIFVVGCGALYGFLIALGPAGFVPGFASSVVGWVLAMAVDEVEVR